MKLVRVCDHTFICDWLNDNSVLLDCGVNHGDFSKWIEMNIGCSIYGFEPDPGLFIHLPQIAKAQFFPVAILDKIGEMPLNLGTNICSSLIFKETPKQDVRRVKTTTLESFCQQRNIQQIDFLKLDIERAEIGVLENVKPDMLRQIVQITVEFHDHLDIRERPKIKRVIKRLNRLGFYCIRFSFFKYTDTLFINSYLAPLSPIDLLWLNVKSFSLGLKRYMYRMFMRK
ncbi:FkbM family methyltransferase [candidate division TA06 bacterium]|uniref:FkbM family methyltransferase n=1 Tax=candidate division TA06 bacterium TaxID=2250710 RepID=A0A933I7T4_UNCT6|nr:FkbM family methyltransferase [candidate division TA06 bacterium]